MSNSIEGGQREDPEHLDDVPDGVGCAEIWERLSARRAAGNDVDRHDRIQGHVTKEGD